MTLLRTGCLELRRDISGRPALASLEAEVAGRPGTHVALVENASGPDQWELLVSEVHRRGWESWVSLRAAERTADNLLGEIERVDASIQDLSNKGDAVIGSLGTIRTELGKIRRKITDLEASYKQIPREFNATEWNTKIVRESRLLFS